MHVHLTHLVLRATAWEPNACGLAPSAGCMGPHGRSFAVSKHFWDHAIGCEYIRSGLTPRTPVLPLGSRLALRRSFTTFGQRKTLTRQCAPRSALIRSMSSKVDAEVQSKAGGSAWIPSGVILALGGALPGLLLAWRWRQVIRYGIYKIHASNCVPN